MKVLIVNTVPTGRNGITNVIFNYLRAADRTALQMDLVSMNKPDDIYVNKIEAQGGHVYVIARNGGNMFSYWRRLENLIKNNGYDAVHIHGNSHTTVLELTAARAAGCVVGVVHAHNTTCKHVVVHKVLTPVFNALCTHRLACGEAAGHFMFGRKSFTVMNNGVDTHRFAFDAAAREKMRKKLGWEYSKVIGHVGYFSEVKNHKFIVDVFEHAYRKDKGYRLLLIGDGRLREDIEAQIAEKGLTNVVHLTGNIDNVEEYLNAMDVILMPSLFEGLPLTLIEQQANGLRCVVSDAITKEVDKTGNVVFLPLSESPESWAGKLDAVVDSCDRKDRSEKSIARISDAGYSIQKEALKLKEFYQNINK